VNENRFFPGSDSLKKNVPRQGDADFVDFPVDRSGRNVVREVKEFFFDGRAALPAALLIEETGLAGVEG